MLSKYKFIVIFIRDLTGKVVLLFYYCLSNNIACTQTIKHNIKLKSD